MNEEGVPILPLLDRLVGSLLFRTRGEPAAQQATLDFQRVRPRRKRDRRRARAVGREWRAQTLGGPGSRLIRFSLVERRDFHGVSLSTSCPEFRMVNDAKPQEKATHPSRVGVSWGPADTPAPRRGGLWCDGGRPLRPLSAPRFLGRRKCRSVQIDRPQSTAVIRYERGKLGVADLMQRLAAALRGTPEAAARSSGRQPLAARSGEIETDDPSPPRPPVHLGGGRAISPACSACGTRSLRGLRFRPANRPPDRVGSRGAQQRGPAALRNLADPLRSLYRPGPSGS